MPSEAPVELSDQVLNQLGILSFTNQENYQAAKKVVLVIMSTRRAEAAGMMAGIGRDLQLICYLQFNILCMKTRI